MICGMKRTFMFSVSTGGSRRVGRISKQNILAHGNSSGSQIPDAPNIDIHLGKHSVPHACDTRCARPRLDAQPHRKRSPIYPCVDRSRSKSARTPLCCIGKSQLRRRPKAASNPTFPPRDNQEFVKFLAHPSQLKGMSNNFFFHDSARGQRNDVARPPQSVHHEKLPLTRASPTLHVLEKFLTAEVR